MYLLGKRGCLVSDSMLQDLFGSNSMSKVLDFLLENRYWEYTKKGIAENAGVSRVHIYRLWPILEKYEIIKESRQIGATSLFTTNLKSPTMRLLESVSLEIAKSLNKAIVKEEIMATNDERDLTSEHAPDKRKTIVSQLSKPKTEPNRAERYVD